MKDLRKQMIVPNDVNILDFLSKNQPYPENFPSAQCSQMAHGPTFRAKGGISTLLITKNEGIKKHVPAY